MKIDKVIPRDVEGSGGGGKGGGGGSAHGIKEAPNTLRSKAVARVQDLVSEGEIVGLVDGLSSIYLDETPVVQPQTGEVNFEGVTFTERVGSPDQDHVPGFPQAESEVPVGVEVRRDIPIVRQINDPGIDAVRVTIRIPTLFKQDKKSGDLEFYQVTIGIEVASDGGSYIGKVVDTIHGKTVNPYERTYRVELPEGGSPWNVRVTRISEDDDAANLNSTTVWARYTEIIDNKFTYPDSAYYSLEADAQQFGGRIPRRAFEIDGLKVQVPSNYDPVNRSYSGIWDGSFKTAHTDNPAWVFYDLIMNDRYGLGQWISKEQIDKFGLYAISQYCDAVDSNGNFVGVDDGKGGKEPRFTYNGVINTREEAFNVVQAVASAFRGMAFWSTGTISAAQDRPDDAVILVSRANVIDGEFKYTGTGFKSRHSSVRVTWNDPDNSYRADVEAVEDPDLIARFGFRPKDVALPGCTSQGMANRFARWVLETEKSEQEIVKYRASLDHMIADGTAVLPGDIIMINDPTLAGVRFGGRLAEVSGTTLTLDAEVTLVSGESYDLNVVLPDGTVETRNVTTSSGTKTDTLQVDAVYSQTPLVNAMWVLTATNLSPTKWRVQGIRETDGNIVEVTATEHDPTKYARVEKGIDLERPRYSTVPTGPLINPNSISARHTLRETDQGTLENVLVIGWEPSTDPRVNRYELQIAEPGQGFESGYILEENSFTMSIRKPGLYRFRVRSLSNQSKANTWVTGDIDVDSLTSKRRQVPPPPGLELYNGRNATTFNNRDAKFVWRRPVIRGDNRNPFNGPQGSDTFQDDPQLKDYEIRIIDNSGTEVRREYVKEEQYTYTYDKNIDDGGPYRTFTIEVRARLRNGVQSYKPAKITVSNPVPDLPTSLSITGGIGTIFISFDRPDVADFVGCKVWAETGSGYDVTATDPIIDGAGNSFALDVAENTNYYIRIALFDTYGDDPATLNVTSEFLVKSKGSVSPEDIPEFNFTGLRFQPNDPSTNDVSWTAGGVSITKGGTTTNYSISSGSTTWTSGVLYIYYLEGDSVLKSTTDITIAAGAQKIVLATYKGGTDLIVGNGDAFIDGSRVLAQTIGASQLVTGQAIITGTAQLANAIVTNAKIDSVAVNKLAAGTFGESMEVGQAEIVIDGTQSLIQVSDQQSTPVTRVQIGKLGAGDTDYGIVIYDEQGNTLLSSGGIGDAFESGGGGAQFGVDLEDASGNIVNESDVVGLFNPIDTNNISTFIAGAVIGDAYIQNLSASKISAGNLGVSGTVYIGDPSAGAGYTVIRSDGEINVHDGNRTRVWLGKIGTSYGLIVDGPGGERMIDGRSGNGINGTYIQNLTVGTLKIQSGALTSTSAAFNGGWHSVGRKSWNTICSASVYCSGDSRVSVVGAGFASRTSYMRITGPGISVRTARVFSGHSMTLTDSGGTSPGWRTYYLQGYGDVDYSSSSFSNSSLFVVACNR